MKKAFLLLIASNVLLTKVFAHGGHTALESNLWHYILSPDHLFFAILVLILGTYLIFRRKLSGVKSPADKR